MRSVQPCKPPRIVPAPERHMRQSDTLASLGEAASVLESVRLVAASTSQRVPCTARLCVNMNMLQHVYKHLTTYLCSQPRKAHDRLGNAALLQESMHQQEQHGPVCTCRRSDVSRSGLSPVTPSKRCSAWDGSAYVHSIVRIAKLPRRRCAAAYSVPMRCGTMNETARSLVSGSRSPQRRTCTPTAVNVHVRLLSRGKRCVFCCCTIMHVNALQGTHAAANFVWFQIPSGRQVSNAAVVLTAQAAERSTLSLAAPTRPAASAQILRARVHCSFSLQLH